MVSVFRSLMSSRAAESGKTPTTAVRRLISFADSADRRGHHLRGAVGDLGQQVAQEMDATSLSGGSDHHGLDGGP